MTLQTTEARRPDSERPVGGGRTGFHGRDLQSWAWSVPAVVAAVGLAALYPLSADAVSPLALPAAAAGVVLTVITLRRPGVGLGVAFLFTALTPGIAGPLWWVPGLVWTAMLVALLALLPGDPADGRAARLPPVALPALVYGATVLFAYALSPAPDLGLPILRSTVTGILLFLVAASTLRSWKDITDTLLGTSGAAVLVGGFACLQHVRGASTGIGFLTSSGALVGRATAGFVHPNQLGGFLALLVPLCAAAALVDRRWRLLHVAGMTVALGGVYASYSRGALLAVLIMPFVLVKGRWLLLLAPVAVLASVVAVPSVMSERFAFGGQEGAEIAGRGDIWSTAGAIWVQRPLVGNGLGSFPGSYASARVVGKQFLADTRFEPPPHAHNLELQLLAEQGLIGITAFAALAALAGRAALQLRRSRLRRHAVLGAGLLASLVGMLAHNLFDVTLLENTGIQLWGVVGILSAVVALDRAEGGSLG